MMSASGTPSNGHTQEVPRASDAPLIFHHLRMAAEATALTPASDPLYIHDQEVGPAPDLLSYRVPDSDRILQPCLHHPVQQRVTRRANALLTK